MLAIIKAGRAGLVRRPVTVHEPGGKTFVRSQWVLPEEAGQGALQFSGPAAPPVAPPPVQPPAPAPSKNGVAKPAPQLMSPHQSVPLQHVVPYPTGGNEKSRGTYAPRMEARPNRMPKRGVPEDTRFQARHRSEPEIETIDPVDTGPLPPLTGKDVERADGIRSRKTNAIASNNTVLRAVVTNTLDYFVPPGHRDQEWKRGIKSDSLKAHTPELRTAVLDSMRSHTDSEWWISTQHMGYIWDKKLAAQLKDIVRGGKPVPSPEPDLDEPAEPPAAEFEDEPDDETVALFGKASE